MWKDIEDCNCFSVGRIYGVSNTAQMCIFIRMVFMNITVKEELLTVFLMKEYTRGDDIFQSFKNLEKTLLPMYRLMSITTDGAPAMVGLVNRCADRTMLSQTS